MNIAILIPELGGGGAERVAQIVGNHYFERGEKVYYFLADNTTQQEYPVKGQVINTGIKGGSWDDSTGYYKAMGTLIKSSLIMRKFKWKYHIDVAISFMEEFNYINVLSKGREKVVTRICTVLSQQGDFKGPLYSKKMINSLYNLSDIIIVMSNYVKEDMYKVYGISLAKMYKIPNPAIRYAEIEPGKRWEYGDKSVICIGRLMKVKQQERIIRAFSYVKFHCVEASLIILGIGPNKKYLENLCKKYGIENSVHFIGFTNNTGFYLKNSRVFVMASSVEGFPNSMVEAMAHGLPVVTTNCPGACGEIVGGKNIQDTDLKIQYCKYGILTPYISGKIRAEEKLSEQEKQLGEGILSILNNDELYDKYAKQSLKRASMYRLEKVMMRWDKVVESERRNIK
ncbi:MAG: glycosyltransferase [Lachnospiraceae bacterium]|nr:glycosyltransferase [Lachnospiraceae bacterium]